MIFTAPLLRIIQAVSGFFLLLFSAIWQPVVADSGENIVCQQDAGFSHRKLNSEQTENLCEVYHGKVILVVNTASKCAFTDQYEGLEKLYADLKDRGLVVIGFPSNDFAGQEPGSEQSIQQFCRLTYGVQFPMYSKTVVKGEAADPLFKRLAEVSGTAPRWNFHKYLIDREGRLVDNFSSFTKPSGKRLLNAIEKVL